MSRKGHPEQTAAAWEEAREKWVVDSGWEPTLGGWEEMIWRVRPESEAGDHLGRGTSFRLEPVEPDDWPPAIRQEGAMGVRYPAQAEAVAIALRAIASAIRQGTPLRRKVEDHGTIPEPPRTEDGRPINIRTDDLEHAIQVGSIGFDVEGNRLRVESMGRVGDSRVIVVKCIGTTRAENRWGSASWSDAMFAGDLMPEKHSEFEARIARHPDTVGLWPPFLGDEEMEDVPMA